MNSTDIRYETVHLILLFSVKYLCPQLCGESFVSEPFYFALYRERPSVLCPEGGDGQGERKGHSF